MSLFKKSLTQGKHERECTQNNRNCIKLQYVFIFALKYVRTLFKLTLQKAINDEFMNQSPSVPERCVEVVQPLVKGNFTSASAASSPTCLCSTAQTTKGHKSNVPLDRWLWIIHLEWHFEARRANLSWALSLTEHYSSKIFPRVTKTSDASFNHSGVVGLQTSQAFIWLSVM